MALATLKGVKVTPSGMSIINMGELRDSNPELFPDGGMQMDYKVFEADIRPHNFIYVRDDVNSLSFTLQNGAIKEAGVNGCQVTDIIEVAAMIIDGLNGMFPCKENAETLHHLTEAINWQQKRTERRETAGIEGTEAEQEPVSTIIVNGVEHKLHAEFISYKELVAMADLNTDAHWSVVIHYPNGKSIIVPVHSTEPIVVSDGMKVSIANTGNA